jgi:hypothetical protein
VNHPTRIESVAIFVAKKDGVPIASAFPETDFVKHRITPLKLNT